MTATVNVAWRPYRCVEVALAVHGDVQPRLGALDGNNPEPHRNQVELHCNKKKKEERESCNGSCSEIHSYPHHTHTHTHTPLQIPPPHVLCSVSVKGEDEMCRGKKKRKRQGRISRRGEVGRGNGASTPLQQRSREKWGKKTTTTKKQQRQDGEFLSEREKRRGRGEIWRKAQHRK